MPPALSNKPEHFSQNVAATNRWAIQMEGELATIKKSQKDAPNQIAKVVQNETNNGSAKVELIVPPQFTPVDQTVSLPGPLKLAWAPEAPSTFLGTLPASGVAGLKTLESGIVSFGHSDTVSIVNFIPGIGKGEWALWIAKGATQTIDQPGHGWKNIWGSDSPSYTNFVQTLNVNSSLPLPLTTSVGGVDYWATAAALFAGVPRIVKTSSPGTTLSGGGSTPDSGTATVTFSNVSTGNSVLVIYQTTVSYTGNSNPLLGATGAPPTMQCEDSNSNSYSNFLLSHNNAGSVPITTTVGASIFAFMAENVIGGDLTISLPWQTPQATTISGLISVFEFTPIKVVQGTPFFRKIIGQPIGADGDLPLPTLTTVGAVAASGSVTHEFVESINDDGSVTLSQPDFTDLSGEIAISQMDHGTNASATTFWRGDGVWKNPNASLAIAIKSSSTYTVQITDTILEFTDSAAIVTLLASSGKWTLTYAGTGTCTINPPGAETISGFSSIVLIPGQSVDIFYDGTNFKIS